MSGSQSTQQQQGSGLGVSTGQSSHSGQSNFGQNVWNPQILNSLYGAANQLFNTTSGNIQSATPQATQFSNTAANQALGANNQQLQGGVYNGLNIGNQLMSSLNKSLNSPSATQSIYSSIMGGNGNSYLPAMKSALETDARNTMNINSGTNAAQAAASGMSGGSRQGVMDALNNKFTAEGLNRAKAEMGYNTFDKDLQNKLGIALQADANTLGRQNLLSSMLGQQQGTINQGINNTGNLQNWGSNALNLYNAPWQGFQQYANTVGRPTVLNTGQSSNTGQASNFGWGMNQSSGSGKSGGGGI